MRISANQDSCASPRCPYYRAPYVKRTDMSSTAAQKEAKEGECQEESVATVTGQGWPYEDPFECHAILAGGGNQQPPEGQRATVKNCREGVILGFYWGNSWVI